MIRKFLFSLLQNLSVADTSGAKGLSTGTKVFCFVGSADDVTLCFGFILSVKVTATKITYNTTYELPYNTTKTLPGGAIEYDYPLAFNMNLKREIYLNIKYKVRM